MLEMLDRPEAFWKRTDQTFLEAFFPDWHGLPVFFNMLQYVWFNLPELWDWQSSVRALPVREALGAGPSEGGQLRP